MEGGEAEKIWKRGRLAFGGHVSGPEKAEGWYAGMGESGHLGWPRESLVESGRVHWLSRCLLWLSFGLTELLYWARDPH